MSTISHERKLLLASAAFLLAGSFSCGADPLGGTVVGGTATIQSSPKNVTVTQTSPSAIINWNTFDIGPGETTRFNQPNSSSVVLNRVTGGLGPSGIYGTLSANGNVFLINPWGVLVGPTGVINTAGFLATTADIRNADFMAGRYVFGTPGRSDASIVNQGRITAASGGFAALVAPGVRNSGTITATLGTASLAAGNTFTLDLYGDKLIQLAPGDAVASRVVDVATGKPLSALVSNDGTISAGGGRIELTAAAARQVVDAVINNTGVLEADTIGTRAGKIVLGAATAASKGAGAPTQTVKVSGTVSAAGNASGTTGGTILVTGENIALSGARIDASGRAGGGKVLIGGDWGGGKPTVAVNNPSAVLETYQIPTATTLSVDAASVINASATGSGSGGKVILWSDTATTFAGTILARGGDTSGGGGFVETSSKGQLNFTGQVNTLAPNGSAGTLLLDPADYYIISGGSVPNGASSITNTTLQSQLANNNVVIATNNATNPTEQFGDINVYAPINWSSANSLTLNAFRNINVAFDITNTGVAPITLRADSTGTGKGTVNFGEASIWTGGPASIFYNPTFNPGNGTINPSSYTTPTDYSNNMNGGGSLTAYMLVNNAADLQNIQNNLTGTYALGKNITAGTMTPIGAIWAPFTGIFDGQNNTIKGATITATGPIDNNIGLFGAIGVGGSVRNLTLDSFTVTANGSLGPSVPGQFIGTLAGSNFGTISNVTVTNSTVNGLNLAGVIAGGLVGQNGTFSFNADNNLVQTPGTITGSKAAVTVTVGNGCSGDCNNGGGFNAAGGLVGSNTAGSTITNSSATGAVSGGSNSSLGGLVGQNGLLYFFQNGDSFYQTIAPGTITGSWASGAVSSTGTNVWLGGLAGTNAFGSTIITSRATGNVTDTTATSGNRDNCSDSCQQVTAGGLVGQNDGTIGTAASAAPPLNQTCTAGWACATGIVTVGIGGRAGGLAGANGGTIGNAFAIGNVVGGDQSNVGGLVGDNHNGNDSGGSNCSDTCPPGIIAGAWASGTVSAGVGGLAGGLAGTNDGVITTTNARGAVSAGANSIIGGLVGGMGPGGYVTLSSATGPVTSTGANSMVGGLIGGSFGLVTLSHASGAVGGTTDSYLGGLIGANAGAIVQSYATGPVTGSGTGNFAGGLAGANIAWGPLDPNGSYTVGIYAYNATLPATGSILQSYSTGAVSSGANSYVGSLAGANLGSQQPLVLLNTDSIANTFTDSFADTSATSFSPSIVQSYATGAATGGANSYVAGLVALNLGTVDQTYATGAISGGTSAVLGGLIASNSSSSPPVLPSYPSPLSTCKECTGFVQALITAGTGTVTHSYWDTNTTGQTTSAGGSSPMTTAQLTSGLPLGYDSSVWSINAGASYPYLLNPKQLPPPAPASLDPPSPPPPPPTSPQPQVVQQLTATVTTPNTSDVVNTQTVTQQQPPPSPPPGQGQQPPPPSPPGGKIPGQLDVGPGRFFYVPPPGETRFVSNKVFLQLDSSVPLSELERIASILGLTIVATENFGLIGKTVYELQINNGAPVASVIPKLAEYQSLTHVSPVYQFYLMQDRTQEGDPGQYVIEKLKLSDVHRSVRGNNVDIAVIDSEIDVRHPDLAGVIREHYDATGVDESPHPHGTGMAGAIASHSRLMGVAPNARLHAIRAFATKSATTESTTLNILKGLDHAVASGVRIVNMSFAGPRDPSIERALKAAYDKGVVLIAAAGNAGPKSPPLYPAADANVIAVTATDLDDKLFPGANRGRYIAVAAPGVDIMVPAPAGGYQLTTGTSVATAHVSGVVALMLERNPRLTPAEVRHILLASARRLGPSDQFGAGLIDPAKAVALATPRSASVTP